MIALNLRCALVAAVMSLAILSPAKACERCGLFGNRCLVQKVQHAQAIVAQPLVYPSINYFVGAPVRVEALVTKALEADPQYAEFQKFRQWQALTQAQRIAEPERAIATVLKAKCATCHGGATPKKGLLFDGSAPLTAEQAIQAMRMVQAGKMPPPEKAKLSAEEAGDVFSELLDLSKPVPKPGGDP